MKGPDHQEVGITRYNNKIRYKCYFWDKDIMCKEDTSKYNEQVV